MKKIMMITLKILQKIADMLTKPWREIFDPSGSNISQVGRYI